MNLQYKAAGALLALDGELSEAGEQWVKSRGDAIEFKVIEPLPERLQVADSGQVARIRQSMSNIQSSIDRQRRTPANHAVVTRGLRLLEKLRKERV